MKNFIWSICLVIVPLLIIGCEPTGTTSPNFDYPFSTNSTVASISEPVGGKSGDLAKIVTKDSAYVIIVTEGVNLQRLNDTVSGYKNIPVEEFKIIVPGDGIQFAWTIDQIDYSSTPPVIRADTIIIMK